MAIFALICNTDIYEGKAGWQFFPAIGPATTEPVYTDPEPIQVFEGVPVWDKPMSEIKGIHVTFDAVKDETETWYVVQLGALRCLKEPAYAEHRAALCRLIGVDINGLPVDDPSQTKIIAMQSQMLYDLREELREANEKIEAGLALVEEPNVYCSRTGDEETEFCARSGCRVESINPARLRNILQPAQDYDPNED